MNRAQRRKLGIKNTKPEVSKKMGLFDKLPDQCTNCTSSYDRKNKEMAMTWTVVVREEEGKVNLYCPTCWDNANKLIKEIREEINEDKS